MILDEGSKGRGGGDKEDEAGPDKGVASPCLGD